MGGMSSKTNAEHVLREREAQIEREAHTATQPATRADILALEKTVINAARLIADTVMRARY